MRIECTHGCGAMLDVERPPLGPPPEPGVKTPYPNEAERRMFEQLGQTIYEKLLGHYLFDCPVARAADADCGDQSPMGYVCNRQTGHDHLPHEYQVEDDTTETGIRVIAQWPNLKAVPGGG